jgi:diguanylate cyclase (GGDEF)-like protein/PAS domain S-box-containing protein
MTVPKSEMHRIGFPLFALLVSLLVGAGSFLVYKVIGGSGTHLDADTQSLIVVLTRTENHIVGYQKTAKAYFLNPTKVGKEALKFLNTVIASRRYMIELRLEDVSSQFTEEVRKELKGEFIAYYEALSSLNTLLNLQGLLQTEQKEIEGHLRALDHSITYIHTESLIASRNAALARQVSRRNLSFGIIVLSVFLAFSVLFFIKLLLKLRNQSSILKSSDNRLRLALSVTKQGWFDLNLQTGEALSSPEYATLLGYDPVKFHGDLQGWQASLHPDDHDAVMTAFRRSLSEGSTFNAEYRRSTKDGGDWLWFETTAEIVEWDLSQQPLRAIGIHTVITERKQAEGKLYASEQKLSSLVNSQSDLICRFTADGTLTFVNDSYISFVGDGNSELLGHSIYQYIPANEHEAVKVNLSQLSVEKPSKKHENSMVSANGEGRIIEWIDQGLFDSNRALIEIQSVGRDVTEMRESQNEVLRVHEKLEYIARYDSLTNLPNRVLLADRLSEAMAQSRRRNQSLAIAYLDLDGFKAVNDTYGHHMGDDLLITVSQRMKETLREGDTLARIGGDEFIVVMVDLDKIEDSLPLLERLLKAAAEPANVGDAIVQVSVSIGATFYPQNDVDADQLIRHADEAMYVAKHAGKNRYHLFDTKLNKEIAIRWESIQNIRSALGRHEFVLHYQPKVNMNTGEVVGVEALIRWQHPERGLVPPLEFLPAIEGHDISLELGEWVIDTALNQIGQWCSMAVDLPISVNISAYQLQQDNFATRLATLLASHPEVNPRYLELEILETSVLNDIDQVSATMNACHDLGVQFSLDDFGTGYSSLTHLRRLPVDLIKIDRSFVLDMLEDADDLAMVESIIGLARSFKREVIASGVESTEHGVALLQLGCELALGYGIARSMPADDIPEWVSSWQANDPWQGRDVLFGLTTKST